MTDPTSSGRAAAFAAGEPARGTVVVPTMAFGFYLLAAAGGGLLLISGLRLLRLSVGWTAEATLAAVAAVGAGAAVGAFWGGLVAERTARPCALLAVVQAGLGLAAFLSVPLFHAARSGYLALWPLLGGSAAGTWGLRLQLALALLVLPSLCFAAMPPLMARLVVPRHRGSGIGVGFSSGLTLLGLALGLGVGGTLIFPTLGLRGTFLLGAAMAGLAAAGTSIVRQCGMEGEGCVGVALSGVQIRDERPAAEVGPPPGWITLGGKMAAGTLLLGFTTWAYLVAWSRSLTFALGDTLAARAVVGAVFLLGLGIGSLLAAGLVDRIGSPCLCLMSMVAASSLVAYASGYFVPGAGLLYLRLTPLLDRPGLTQVPALLTAAALLLPSSLLLGAALPVLPMAAGARQRPVVGAASLMALGAVLAEAVVALLVVPAFGLRRSLSLAAAVGLLAAILFLGGVTFRRPTYRTTFSLSLLLLMVLLGLRAASWDPRLVGSGFYRYGAASLARFGSVDRLRAARRGAEVPFYREGRNSTVMIELAYEASPGLPPTEALALSVDGNVTASTGSDIRAQVLLAHLPILMHGPTERVLLIDFLNGVAAGSVLRHPVKSLTIIEEERALFEAATGGPGESPPFASYNHSPLADPRVRRVVDSARARLAVDQTLYDVIVLASMQPWRPSRACLLTAEGYDLIRSRLRPDGLLAQRVQVSSTTRPALEAVLRTFADAFESVLLFQIAADDLLLVGSSEPLALDVGWFRNVIGSSAEVAVDLARVTVLGANELLLTYRLDGGSLRALVGDGPSNRDDPAPVEVASARQLRVHDGGPLIRAIDSAWAGLVPVLKNYGALPRERARFLYGLAKSYLGIAGDAERARGLARELAEMGETAMSRWVMGESLIQRRDVNGAIEQWRAVLDLEPDNLDALFSLGTFYLDGHDYWKAVPYLERASRAHPDTAVVRYHYGRSLYFLDRHEEAIRELRKARELAGASEQYPLVDYLVGVSTLRVRRYDEAAKSLEAYLDWAYRQSGLTRLEVDAHLKLAEAYDGLGRRFQAHRQRQKAEELRRRILASAARRGGGTGAGAAPAPEDRAEEALGESISDLP
ncbi:MAG: CDC27 family protein [Acidobacteriota bacterium]